MIEDSELRVLFQAESDEKLSHMEACLQKLESDLYNKNILEEVFRDAHSMKGNASMVGEQSIEILAHKLEDILDYARKGFLELTPEIIKPLYQTIEELKLLVMEAVRGITSNIDVKEAAANLQSLLPEELKNKDKDAIEKEVVKSSAASKPPVPEKHHPISQSAERAPEESAEEHVQVEEKTGSLSYTQSLQSTLIRIPLRQLNDLNSHAADLTVTTNHILSLFEQIDQLLISLERENTFAIGEAKQHLMQDVVRELHKIKDYAYENIYKLESVTNSMVELISKIGLVPISKLFSLFPHPIEDLAKAESKEIQLVISGGEIPVDKRIIEDMKDPLMHMLRNSVSHGIEPPNERIAKGKPRKGVIRLGIQQEANIIVIEVSDDGKGLDVEKIKSAAFAKNLYSEEELERMTTQEIFALIFLPGFSTSEKVSNVSGRGVGMDVVNSNIEKLFGTIQIESKPDVGCKFQIRLPTTLVTTHVLLIDAFDGKSLLAIPMEVVKACMYISFDQLSRIEGRDVAWIQDELLPVALLADILKMEGAQDYLQKLKSQNENLQCIVLKVAGKPFVLIVGSILDEQRVVVTPLNPLLAGLRGIIGSTILKTGQVCLVINPVDLIKRLHHQPLASLSKSEEEKSMPKKKILVVDDSPLTRNMLRILIESIDFVVLPAENGFEALHILEKEGDIRAVISDLNMSKMNGFELCKKIRGSKQFQNLPIILLSMEYNDKNIKEGLQAGANAFLNKTDFGTGALIQKIKEVA